MSAPQPNKRPTPRWPALSADDREREYSPSSCVGGDFSPFIAAYVERSAAARAAFDSAGIPIRALRYGPGPSQTVDLVVPTTGGDPYPLMVYLHGGYWQLLSKAESLFPGPGCLAHEVAFAAVDYTLAPDATLDQIVEECRQALAMLLAAAPEHRIDPGRVVVGGSSAGAHLAAMMGLGLADGWRPAGLVLVSGIYELEPLLGTSINEAVGLDIESARRNSPMLADLGGMPPTIIAYGDNETSEFKLQSDHMAVLLDDAGTDVSTMEIAPRNHFDVILDLCDDHTTLGSAVFDLVDRTA